MIAEGTEASAVTPEQIATVIADTQTFIDTYRRQGVTSKYIAQALGYSPGVISDFLGGKYRGNVAQVAIDLDTWLVEEEVRRQRPQTTQFVWTNVAMEIKSVASFCVDRRKIGLVYGPDTAGLGKTTALQAILQDIGPRRAALATIDKVDANPTGLLTKLCHAVRVDDSGSNRNRFERVVRKLTTNDDIRGSAGGGGGAGSVGGRRSHLLMIDQIHNLRYSKDDKPFYILSDLYDATGTAQLWCGTADLHAYLFKQQRKHADESLAQIRSRVFPVVDLMAGLAEGGGAGGGGGGEPLVTVEQVREMFAKNKLKLTDAAARFLMTLANLPDSGAVRLCVQLVEYATEVGELKSLKSIDVPLLKLAMRRGLVPGRVEQLLAQAERPADVRRVASA